MVAQSSSALLKQISPAYSVALLPESERLDWIASLSEREAAIVRWSWKFWARPEQLAPAGDWLVWLILSGRGWGKSRTGAEWVCEQIIEGHCRRMALIAATAADARDVMVEGESGILNISPPWFRPIYQPSKRRLTWPNGAIATLYTADKPGRLRGPQHDGAWADEVAEWRYPEAWDQLMFGLRLGRHPRVVATTTPKPKKLIRDLLSAPTTHVTRGTTYDNLANLANTFRQQVLSKYEGTRLGKQELGGELLDDVPGALWTRTLLDECTVTSHPPLRRIVVAMDPATTSKQKSDNTGIIGVGKGEDGLYYVLADETIHDKPAVWARQGVALYHRLGADRLVAEANNGGDLIENTIRAVNKEIAYKAVHAARGKRTRAEPIAALYEQKRVRHVGSFPHLEDEMCSWDPLSGAESPDRMDALVWGITELMEDGGYADIGSIGGQSSVSQWSI